MDNLGENHKELIKNNKLTLKSQQRLKRNICIWNKQRPSILKKEIKCNNIIKQYKND